MMSKHSVEERFEIVMESLDHNTTQTDICRRHGIFPTQLAKWPEPRLNLTRYLSQTAINTTLSISENVNLPNVIYT